jgi:arsenate reductase
MAEAMARALGEGEIEAFSAGLAPAGSVADSSLATLGDLGYDSAGLASKGLEEVPLHDMDVIVSLAGPSALYMVPQGLTAEREAWSIPDPVGEDLAAYHRSAKLIEAKVSALVTRLRERDDLP